MTARADILKRIDVLKAIANGSRLSRFTHTPVKYIVGILNRHVVYRILNRSAERKCRTILGDPFNVLLPSGLDIYLLGLKTHDSEIRLAKFLVRELRPGMQCYDVGAHFGFYSLMMDRLCGDTGRILSLEPHPVSFSLLQKNTAGTKSVTPLNLAVGENVQLASMASVDTLYLESSKLSEKKNEMDLPVEMVTLEYLFDMYFKPDLIKIDVEGSELKVIKGLGKYSGKVPLIIMEYLREDPEAIYLEASRLLHNSGYQSYRITDNGGTLPVTDISEMMYNTGMESENILFKIS